MEAIELDLKEFPEDLKDMLIMISINEQIPVDEVINKLLKQYLENSKK